MVKDRIEGREEQVALDFYLAEQYQRAGLAETNLVSWDDPIHANADDVHAPLSYSDGTPRFDDRGNRVHGWSMTIVEAWERLLDRVVIHEYSGDVERFCRIIDEVNHWGIAMADAFDETKWANEFYDGWSRFFLVVNNNGHIHSSQYCSTCYDTTHFNWLPALSGLTEADAVEAHGAILCTVCFPSAPVEWTNGERKVDDGRCTQEVATVRVEGSWRYGYNGDRYQSGYGICGCGKEVAILQNGKPRKHMALTTEEIEKAAALEIKRAKRAEREAQREAEWKAELAAMRAERAQGAN